MYGKVSCFLLLEHRALIGTSLLSQFCKIFSTLANFLLVAPLVSGDHILQGLTRSVYAKFKFSLSRENGTNFAEISHARLAKKRVQRAGSFCTTSPYRHQTVNRRDERKKCKILLTCSLYAFQKMD
jgi:hypothetical protein